MPHVKLIFLLFFAVYSLLKIYSAEADSVVTRKSLFIIPHAGYQQETNWAFGLAGGFYFKSNDISRISSISGSAEYTLLNQFIFNITPKIYFGDKKWYMYSNLNFKKFPDKFYGVGNSPSDLIQPYVSNNFSLLLQPQYSVTKEVFLGAIFGIKSEAVQTDESFDLNKEEIFLRYGSEGWSPFAQYYAGLMASYDSRDNQFYPEKGIFAKSMLSFSDKRWGSSFSVTDFSVDFRQYLPVFKRHVFAWQAIYSGAFSGNEIPFQLLPTLGGRDVMRGFRQGMYRENVMMLLQTEYRLPVYKRLKVAIFASAGDVVNSENYQIDKLKIAYGAGLRYRLNDARVHLRFDIAKNNYGEKLQFYITATEAF